MNQVRVKSSMRKAGRMPLQEELRLNRERIPAGGKHRSWRKRVRRREEERRARRKGVRKKSELKLRKRECSPKRKKRQSCLLHP